MRESLVHLLALESWATMTIAIVFFLITLVGIGLCIKRIWNCEKELDDFCIKKINEQPGVDNQKISGIKKRLLEFELAIQYNSILFFFMLGLYGVFSFLEEDYPSEWMLIMESVIQVGWTCNLLIFSLIRTWVLVSNRTSCQVEAKKSSSWDGMNLSFYAMLFLSGAGITWACVDHFALNGDFHEFFIILDSCLIAIGSASLLIFYLCKREQEETIYKGRLNSKIKDSYKIEQNMFLDFALYILLPVLNCIAPWGGWVSVAGWSLVMALRTSRVDQDFNYQLELSDSSEIGEKEKLQGKCNRESLVQYVEYKDGENLDQDLSSKQIEGRKNLKKCLGEYAPEQNEHEGTQEKIIALKWLDENQKKKNQEPCQLKF